MDVTKTKPLHCDGLPVGLWGAWLNELAKDLAAETILEHIEGRGAVIIPVTDDDF